MTNKRLILASKVISSVFSPFYAPLWAFIFLFTFSYLRLLPLGYKIFVLATIYCFTVLIPRLGIMIFRKLNKWTHWQLSNRNNRHVPYILSLASYISCLMLMMNMNMPMFVRGILLAAIVSQIVCAILNLWWKVSTHLVGIGGMTGTLIAFGFLFYFNPLWPLCILLFIAGLLGSSRMILRQHTLAQVTAGFAIGLVSTTTIILMV
ncbi:MAG: hypothetical protein IJY78_07810 [Bacteroidaceae bacterium]|nr:hypothetical protein [Bacteroidaceae bacterium]